MDVELQIGERIFHEAPDGVLLLVLRQMETDTKHDSRLASKFLQQSVDFWCQRLEWRGGLKVNPASLGLQDALSLLTHPSFSARFPNVKHLSLDHLVPFNSLSAIHLIAFNPGQILSLSLDHCHNLSDLSPLSACINLETLSCCETRVMDLSPLSSCLALKHLVVLRSWALLDAKFLEPLMNHPNLEFVAAGRTIDSHYIWSPNNAQHLALMIKYLNRGNMGLRILASMVLGSLCQACTEEVVVGITAKLDLSLVLSRMMQTPSSSDANYDLRRASAFLLYSLHHVTISIKVGGLVASSEGRIFSGLVEILQLEDARRRTDPSFKDPCFKDRFRFFSCHVGDPTRAPYLGVSFVESAMGILANIAFEDENKLRIYHTPHALDLILHHIDEPSSSFTTQARATLALANLADHDELNPLLAAIPGIHDRLLAILGREEVPRTPEIVAVMDIVRPCTALAFANLTDGEEQKLIVGRIEGIVPFLMGYCAQTPADSPGNPWSFEHLFETIQWILMALGNIMDCHLNRLGLHQDFKEGEGAIYSLIRQSNFTVPPSMRQKAVVCLCKAALGNEDKARLVADQEVLGILGSLLANSMNDGNISDQILALETLSCLTDLSTEDEGDESTARCVLKMLWDYVVEGQSLGSLIQVIVENGLNDKAKKLASLIYGRLLSFSLGQLSMRMRASQPCS